MSVREELQEAQWEASKANLAPCPNCGRKFNPDRIVTHQRICQGTSKSGPQSQEDLVRKCAVSSPSMFHPLCMKFTQLSHTAYKHTLNVVNYIMRRLLNGVLLSYGCVQGQDDCFQSVLWRVWKVNVNFYGLMDEI